MTAKKKTTRTKLPQTHKGHQRKMATAKDLPAEASTSVDNDLTEAAETPVKPAVVTAAAESATEATVGSSRTVSPMSAEETTTTAASSSLEPTTSTHPLSALDAAAKVLSETGRAMACQELITAMAANGYWSSPKGRTPAGTLYSAILREMQSKGERSRFVKTERGKFALRGGV